ncbi:hypothetical protein AB0280_16410 [Pseudarthrobacter sp902506025]|uniref:hypothetical protein n=1 Tax=Pseudarthrobacter sp. 902506025 TaxID=3155291 RepID=UPI00344D5621
MARPNRQGKVLCCIGRQTPDFLAIDQHVHRLRVHRIPWVALQLRLPLEEAPIAQAFPVRQGGDGVRGESAGASHFDTRAEAS